MVTKTNEQALEACIEKALTGTCREQLKLEGVGVAEANEQDAWPMRLQVIEDAD